MDSRISPKSPIDRRVWPAGSVIDMIPAADGWPLRRFRMGDGRRGRLLMLNGRADIIEKYIETMDYWAAEGWAVTSFDWRGQGGSGRVIDDPLTGHIDDFSVWIDDLRDVVAPWAAQGDGPTVIVGHSMGGHLLLRALIEGAVAPDAAVLVAPMLGLNSKPVPGWLARLLTWAMVTLGRGRERAWTQSEATERHRKMRQKRLTRDPERYADEQWWKDQNPALTLGPPSWSWLDAAFRSTGAQARADLSGVTVPLLILGAKVDALVSPAAIVRTALRMPQARSHIYGREAAHEILRDWDPVRLDAWARIDAFLDDVAP